MSHMRLWASAAIIAAIILIAFALSVPHTRDIEVKPLPVAVPTVPTVALHDAFKKGLHTISGSIEATNACTPVSASAILVGNASSTRSILVALSIQSDSGICLQIPTRASFKTTISAPANLPLTITVNGSPATMTLL
ncbi:MAG: hypothetical protein AAB850_00400 [Patescibacteria group bacterium]|mgnify:FL=1